MRASRIRRADRFDDCQMLRVEHRLQRSKSRMQTEEAIQVHSRVRRPVRLGDSERGPKLVVTLLAERNHNVQPVHRAALENRYENLLALPGSIGGIHRSR